MAAATSSLPANGDALLFLAGSRTAAVFYTAVSRLQVTAVSRCIIRVFGWVGVGVGVEGWGVGSVCECVCVCVGGGGVVFVCL